MLLFIIFMYVVDVIITLESLIFVQHRHKHSETNRISKVWAPHQQSASDLRLPLLRAEPRCVLNLLTCKNMAFDGTLWSCKAQPFHLADPGKFPNLSKPSCPHL